MNLHWVHWESDSLISTALHFKWWSESTELFNLGWWPVYLMNNIDFSSEREDLLYAICHFLMGTGYPLHPLMTAELWHCSASGPHRQARMKNVKLTTFLNIIPNHLFRLWQRHFLAMCEDFSPLSWTNTKSGHTLPICHLA